MDASQSSSNTAPPPTYSQSGPSGSTMPFVPPGSPGKHPIHEGYGPTPMVGEQAQVLLAVPYHDPTSPHAIALAASRARWRFFEAFIWAFGIWFLVGIITGAGVEESMKGAPARPGTGPLPHMGSQY